MTTETFDLFKALAALGKKDYTMYEKLSEVGQKQAAPIVALRWMSGTSDAAQIVRLNVCANLFLFNRGLEKDSAFKLLAAGATGRNTRYSWSKYPSGKSDKLSIQAIKEYYECSTREAKTYEIAAADLIEMAQELGWTDDELKKLKKELNDESGPAKKAGAKSKKSSRG